jgi:hypothetical protein
MVLYPSGLRELSAKELFVGSNPTSTSINGVAYWKRFFSHKEEQVGSTPTHATEKTLNKVWKCKNLFVSL